MNEAYGAATAIFIGAYLMFIAPVNSMIHENEKLEQMYIVNEITVFTEQVRNTGKIDGQTYLKLENAITGLNGKYNIAITHYKNTYNEEGEIMHFFQEEEYLWRIKEEMEKGNVYTLKKSEYIKITVKSKDRVVAIYGGIVKGEDNGF